MKYLFILLFILAIGCSSTPPSPNDSMEACHEYCSAQKKPYAALVTVRDGQPCKECKCYNTWEELFESVEWTIHITPEQK